jgi:diacylglycerol kinase family enzyme
MYYILYNPLSSNGASLKQLEKLEKLLAKKGVECASIDIIEVSKRVEEFATKLDPSDSVVVVGGDGTLHYFANSIRNISNTNDIYLYKGGTGNDFSREFKGQKLIKITDYIRNLPLVTIDGKEEVFVNGCGYGVDGEVCALVNSSSEKKKGIQYFKNAVSTLKGFNRYDLEIEIDGVRHTYKNVWFSTITNGKYFGGGMKVSPTSDRKDGVLEAIIIHSVSFPVLLFIFPFIFIGKHFWFKSVGITLLRGKTFKLTASRPLVYQTDGEVTEGVQELSVKVE